MMIEFQKGKIEKEGIIIMELIEEKRITRDTISTMMKILLLMRKIKLTDIMIQVFLMIQNLKFTEAQEDWKVTTSIENTGLMEAAQENIKISNQNIWKEKFMKKQVDSVATTLVISLKKDIQKTSGDLAKIMMRTDSMIPEIIIPQTIMFLEELMMFSDL